MLSEPQTQLFCAGNHDEIKQLNFPRMGPPVQGWTPSQVAGFACRDGSSEPCPKGPVSAVMGML